jgi:GNAT superfamily N-acetyltransferase
MPTEHKNGRQVSIRDLSAADGPALRAMFDRLSAETIYGRFHAPYPRVPEPMLAHLMGYADGRSVVAVAGPDIVGHAMYAGGSGGEAEMAVVVEDGWQSMGIGKLLLAGLALRAAGRGVEAFTAVALGENRRVLALVDAVFAGARHTLKYGSYEMSMPLGGPRPAPKGGREIRPAA